MRAVVSASAWAEPLRDDGQRHPPKMQSGAAGMPGVVQPDRPHTGGLRGLIHIRVSVSGVYGSAGLVPAT